MPAFHFPMHVHEFSTFKYSENDHIPLSVQAHKSMSVKVDVSVNVGERVVSHVQASFNNTIMTVTDVQGWVFSWSSTGTCGF